MVNDQFSVEELREILEDIVRDDKRAGDEVAERPQQVKGIGQAGGKLELRCLVAGCPDYGQ